MIDKTNFGKLFKRKGSGRLLILKVLGSGFNDECYRVISWNMNTGKKTTNKCFHYTALNNSWESTK